MSTLRNNVKFIGHVGDTPNVVTLESGKVLAHVSLSTNQRYKSSDGEPRTDTQWHHLVSLGKTAKIFENYVTKGQEIAISGKLTSRL